MKNKYSFYVIQKFQILRPLLRRSMAMESTTANQKPITSIKEGKAEIQLTSEKVFYNPVQEFNRDLSIAVLTIFGEEYRAEKSSKNKNRTPQSLDCVEEPFTILEALSATGLRSIRYAKEIPNVTKITANDLSEQAVATIKDNIVHNNVEHLIETSHDDACMIMYKHKHYAKRFSAIDLDPYGCPSIFLDSAVQSVQDGGILLVTATDMAILAGNSPETCYSKYGAISMKTKCCHEMALRILLQCIEQHANRHSRYIVPLLSISADFYIRVFIKVYTSALQCKKTTSKLSMVYRCVGCDHITLQPLGGFKANPSEKNPQQVKGYLPAAPPVGANCEHCNQKHNLGGPIWSAPIHDEIFVNKVLRYVQDNPTLFTTSKRIEGILSMVQEELVDVPLYYVLDKLFGRVHLQTMPMIGMRSAILNAGYKVSYSHAAKNSIKTTAPGSVIWDIVRTWHKAHPAKEAKIQHDPVAAYLLSKEPTIDVNMACRPDANPNSRRDGCLRFQFNPTPHWGPGSRAEARVGEEKVLKSVLNQNKYTKNKKDNKLKRQQTPMLDEELTCKKNNAQINE